MQSIVTGAVIGFLVWAVSFIAAMFGLVGARWKPNPANEVLSIFAVAGLGAGIGYFLS